MSKPKTPDASLLVLLAPGFSAWARSVPFAQASSVARALALAVEAPVRDARGVLVSFEDDVLAAAFLDSPGAGVVAAARAGTSALANARGALADVKKVAPLAGVQALFVGRSRVKKDLSNLENLVKRSVSVLAGRLAGLRAGSPLVFTSGTESVAKPALATKPVGGAKGLLRAVKDFPRKPAPKNPKAGGRGLALADRMLEPVLRELPVPFSVLTLRVRPPHAAAMAAAREWVRRTGGAELKGPKDLLTAVFHDIADPAGTATNTVRCALLARQDALRILAHDHPKAFLGVAVCSATAPLGQLEKQAGEPFRKTMGAARALATPTLTGEVQVDESTEGRVAGVFDVRPRSGKGPGAGNTIFGIAPEFAFRALAGSPASGSEGALGAQGRKIRDFLRKAEKDGTTALLSASSPGDSARALGAAALAEMARKAGWRVLATVCGEDAPLSSFGLWRHWVCQVAGIGDGEAPVFKPERLRTLLARRLPPGTDEGALQGLLGLFDAAGGNALWDRVGPSSRRRLVEKGLFLLLTALLAEGPVLFVALEGHRADGSSLEFLQRFRTSHPPGTAVITMVHDPEFKLRKPDLDLELPSLSAAQVAQMFRAEQKALSGAKELKGFPDDLGADPFTARLALLAAREKGKLAAGNGSWTLAPKTLPRDKSLRSVSQLRLRGLAPALRELLGHAAAQGSFLETFLYAASAPPAGLEGLVALEEGGWIVPVGLRGGASWSFGPPEYRTRVAALMSLKDRAALHGRLAVSAMEACGRRVFCAGPLAVWQRRAAGDRPALREALLELGRRAKDLGFHAEAELCFREILEFPGPLDAEKAALMLDRAEALTELGRQVEAIALLGSALRSKALRVPKKPAGSL